MKLIVVEAQVLPKHGDGEGKGMEDHGVRAEHLLQPLVVVVELGTHSEAVSHSGKTLVEELCTELLQELVLLGLVDEEDPTNHRVLHHGVGDGHLVEVGDQV